MRTINFGKSKIKYNIVRSDRRKTTAIVVNSAGVQILSPLQKSDEQIQKLVKSHSKWIYKKQLWAQQESSQKIIYANDSKIPYLGKSYQLKVIVAKNDEGFFFRNGKFTAKVKQSSPTKIKKLYIKWLEEKSQFIKNRVKSLSDKTGIKFSKIHIKGHRERWGSMSKNGSLNFNVNLMRMPLKILDYVIMHELCHVQIPNHSSNYWTLLHKVMPDYEQRKEWLRINWRTINS